MPLATEKAFRLSKKCHNISLKKKVLSKYLSSAFCKSLGIHLIHRLGNRHTDMPQNGEARGLKTQKSSSSESKRTKSKDQPKAG
jgi:hypothetical protein